MHFLSIYLIWRRDIYHIWRLKENIAICYKYTQFLHNFFFRSDNPFDTRLELAPINRVTKLLKQMNENGFRDGPEPSQIIGVCEGDIIEINYRVNIQNSSNNKYPRYVFNSNVQSPSPSLR